MPTLILSEKLLFDATPLEELASSYKLGAMDIVRLCGISVNQAYRITNGKPIGDLNVVWKFYKGLQDAGYPVTWEWPALAAA